MKTIKVSNLYFSFNFYLFLVYNIYFLCSIFYSSINSNVFIFALLSYVMFLLCRFMLSGPIIYIKIVVVCTCIAYELTYELAIIYVHVSIF